MTDQIMVNSPICFFNNPKAERTDNSQNGTTAFLESVVNLCRRSENDWYRVYLIRKISSQHGVEFVLKLLNEDTVRWLFPPEVLQKVQLFTERISNLSIHFWKLCYVNIMLNILT